MTRSDDLNDWRTARKHRWTRPDGSLAALEMCRQMDRQYAAMFQTGPMRDNRPNTDTTPGGDIGSV